MSTNLIVMPIVIPMLTAILCMFLNGRDIRFQRVIAGLSALTSLATAIYIFTQVMDGETVLVFTASGWAAPFGIVLAADMLSGVMLILVSIVSAACLYFAFVSLDKVREENYFYPVWFCIMMGINGSFVTGDIFNLYVMFEIMLMASYVLSVIGCSHGQLRESFKYLILNMISSTIFVIALALLYGMLGTLNMADLAQKIATIEDQSLITVCAMIFFVVFGLKGAVFPLYFWLPRTYVEPPAPIAAMFGGVLTKVGVYAMIRVFTLMFIGNVGFTHSIILVVAAFTMLLGVFGALSQMNFKRILSFHVISQVGYMVMGLGLYTVWSLAGAIFYIAHHMIIKSSLFLFEGATEQITGTAELKKMGGLLNKYPWLGWGFFVAGMSLAGVPPLSGFFSKFVLMEAAVDVGNYWILAAALVTGFFTLFSMSKIFFYAFWGEEKPLPETAKDIKYWKLLPSCFVLVALSVGMGLAAEPMMEMALRAANQLMNPEIYINAVMAVPGIRG